MGERILDRRINAKLGEANHKSRRHKPQNEKKKARKLN